MTSKQAWSTRGRYLGQNSKPESSVARFACGVALAALFANIPVAVAQTVGPQQAAPTAAAPATASKPKVKAAAKAGPGVEGGGQAAAKKDPNEASNHVDNGIKLLQGGKIDAAVHTFSSVIGAGKLPPTTMARALYNRGLAYRKQGKQAQAISDLTSALWLKGGLNDAERADALASRVAAYREAGLSDQSTGDDSTAAADNKASATRSKTADQVNKQLTTQSIGQSGTAPAIVAKAPTVAAAAALAPDTSAGSSSGSGVGGLFGNLFGGSSTPAPQAPAQAVATAAPITASTVAAAPAAAQRAVPAKPITVASATALIPAAAAPKAAEAKFRAQIALVRTRAEADVAAKKVKDKFAASLGTSELVIDQTTLGNMGTFFRVRIGPYISQIEAQAVCASLKGSGLDCVPVVQ